MALFDGLENYPHLEKLKDMMRSRSKLIKILKNLRAINRSTTYYSPRENLNATKRILRGKTS
jgi:hypothetical protein